jgi:hypothetical protein
MKIRQLYDGISTRERDRRRIADLSLWEAATADVTPMPAQPLADASNRPRRLPAPVKPLFKDRLDLHGLTVAQAHRKVSNLLDTSGGRSATVVTGRSGVIRQEFHLWLQNDQRIRRVEELHGGGAFRIHFRKMKP